MPAPVGKEGDGHAHIAIPDDHPTTQAEEEVASSPGIKNSKGWDGKLRVPKSALLSNPEALSDSEYSDEENVLAGEQIGADEGESLLRVQTVREKEDVAVCKNLCHG